MKSLWPAAVHESGHAIACQLVGGTVKHIRFFDRATLDIHGRIITGVTRILMPDEPLLRGLVLFSGPIANRTPNKLPAPWGIQALASSFR